MCLLQRIAGKTQEEIGQARTFEIKEATALEASWKEKVVLAFERSTEHRVFDLNGVRSCLATCVQ